MTQEQEQKPSKLAGLAAAGSKEEIDEAVGLLSGVGFNVLLIPVISEDGHSITSPEFRYNGRTYRGLEEIRHLTNELPITKPAQD